MSVESANHPEKMDAPHPIERVTEGHRAALLAGFLGWTLDAFDFFLVVFSLTAIAEEFHRPDKDIALSIAVTLAFRPVGAFIFGLLADRYGRRLPLIIDLIFFSVVEVLSGLAPNYATFLVLRALFGIGMGGEWGVGASLAMEKQQFLLGEPITMIFTARYTGASAVSLSESDVYMASAVPTILPLIPKHRGRRCGSPCRPGAAWRWPKPSCTPARDDQSGHYAD